MSVFPVPGPPAITAIRLASAVVTARARRASGSSRPVPTSRVEEPVQDRFEHVRGSSRAGGVAHTPQQVGGDTLLEAPIALQVKARAVPDEGQDHLALRVLGEAHGRARRQQVPRARRIRPRQLLSGPGSCLVDHDGSCDGDDDNADMPETHGPRGEGRPEQDLGLQADERAGDETGHVDVRRVQHPGLDEGREKCPPAVGHKAATQGGGERHGATAAPSSRSLSELTSEVRDAPGEHAVRVVLENRGGRSGHAAHEHVRRSRRGAVTARSREPASEGSGGGRPRRAGPARGSGALPWRRRGGRGGSPPPGAGDQVRPARSSCSPRRQSAEASSARVGRGRARPCRSTLSGGRRDRRRTPGGEAARPRPEGIVPG